MPFQHLFTLQTFDINKHVKRTLGRRCVKCEMMILCTDAHSAQFQIVPFGMLDTGRRAGSNEMQKKIEDKMQGRTTNGE